MKESLLRLGALAALCSPTFAFAQGTSQPTSTNSVLTEQAQSGPVKELSLSEAVKLALENAPDLQVAAAQAQNAQARYEKAKDSRMPALTIGASVNQYTDKQTICFANEGAPPPLNECESTGGAVPDTVIRGLVTYGAQANLVVPISAQFNAFKHSIDASRYEIDSIEISREVTKREIAWQAEQAYLQFLKVIAAQQAASEGVKLAQAQVDRVKKYFEAGALAKNDLLRAELSLAQAQQQEIGAQTAVLLAEGMLVTMLGLPADTRLVPTESYPTEVPGLTVSLDDAIKAALERRPELAQIEAQISMAGALKDASKSALYPQVALTATSQYSSGSTFQEGVFVFATLNASWTILDWGVAKDQVAAAEASVLQVKASQEKLTQGLILDVRSRYLTLLSAKASLDVAVKSIESATENQRITTTRFDAKAATTTDLLDAQVLLTRAKISEVTARYDYYIALAGLKKAMGESVSDKYFAQATTPQVK